MIDTLLDDIFSDAVLGKIAGDGEGFTTFSLDCCDHFVGLGFARIVMHRNFGAFQAKSLGGFGADAGAGAGNEHYFIFEIGNHVVLLWRLTRHRIRQFEIWEEIQRLLGAVSF